MKNKKYELYAFLLVSGFLIQSCSEANIERKEKDKPVVIEVSSVKENNGEDEIAFSGTIEESEVVPLSFSGLGTISKVLVTEGEFVKKGQLLAELNEETYRNAYEMTCATLKQADDAFKRLEPMYKNGNLSEVKFVEIETALQQAKAANAIAKKSLNDCKLYSPIYGVVGKRNIEPGMNAMANLTSINIIKIEKVFAKVPIAENEISNVKKGINATIKIAAINNKVFNGVVEEIGVMADPIAHTYKIKIGIVNKNYLIKPGMICQVTLKGSSKKYELTIPVGSLLVDEYGKNYVYVFKNNKAQRKFVKTGKLFNQGIEILEGINAGDKIVVSGQHELVDNSDVIVVNN